ncbi:hypothetical protein [Bosea sp. (in: a-proteobacteria)]|uniref:hypothetical protein n=1 Tax=Bosea sp. (in: a-proteobacteria) TaxID=1871050 RepID=UPI002733E323|nr:hypothetical protein [Bosea sp. (in: a-proteobacteria)]MDP3408065.1 hypothetical protein [Bosea sp. (in: a-proteobacteria)]
MLFDIETWTLKGQYGRRLLLKAESTPVMEAALRLRMNDLARIGIGRDFGNRVECWVEPTRDDAAYRAVAEEADAAARAKVAQDELTRETAMRLHRERADAVLVEIERLRVERIAGTLADLRTLLVEAPWLLTGKIAGEAVELAALEDMDGDTWRRARKIVDAAKATRARAETTLRAEAHADAMQRCADGALRDAVLEGCRYLSADDADLASESNGIGWSRSTTVLGHVLAGKRTLTEREAAHGLGLLKTHRRQLPRDLRIQIGI